MAVLVAGRAARTVPLYQSRVPLSTPEGREDWGGHSRQPINIPGTAQTRSVSHEQERVDLGVLANPTGDGGIDGAAGPRASL